ncbi:succinate dehydrogenase assembly factor 2 [Novosphingobium sp. MMS21-SN21R]|uniref:FAD assembly factor SdhE n=1 Tax=Novosphingobium sp. MMS21-SN21R TaxID=2969298 RepID=UPI002883ADA0|nr:succinate dehydrogenase assembly factor 2 [Novosphingobium sp. MMS21-SN21R]MDT0508030.1 succinate dehydrogenase assembly factor 2 [Novosphingobium sp. MMS21-SN21R]
MTAAAPFDPAYMRRIHFRAWHRGTREADYMIGCFFDRFHAQWSAAEVTWFEELIEEDDVEIMAWALGTQDVPDKYQGAMMDAMRKLDYVEIPR